METTRAGAHETCSCLGLEEDGAAARASCVCARLTQL